MILTSLRLELVSQNYLIAILATKDVRLGVRIYLSGNTLQAAKLQVVITKG